MTDMFVVPRGAAGERGAALMTTTGAPMARRAVDALDPGSAETVLEIGFGPGVAMTLLAAAVPDGLVVGVDPSDLMHRWAGRRNAEAVRAGRVSLLPGSAGALPLSSGSVDAALAIDNLHFWPDPAAGVAELRRVVRRTGRVVIAFTPPSGGPPPGWRALFLDGGFPGVEVRRVQEGMILRARAAVPESDL
ncbi:Methyltransferase domain-containing protein [Rhodococcoides kroppenstedtii]|uniref:Methyltransferase domain-containing protein n=1 Tax=Rhodococcoides kroppenstedtii TaxID=293050 RepID=A0A1I0SQF4_9NOCA|nr:class I SAM-dependent methyltransferase [Rhodococcus kroppenstedtii]SFA41712.1 Methyltransferase domain-containing protein [Rhodococcus kroppenstedtii]